MPPFKRRLAGARIHLEQMYKNASKHQMRSHSYMAQAPRTIMKTQVEPIQPENEPGA